MLANLRPAVVANLMVCGPLAIWRILFGVMAILEIAIGVYSIGYVPNPSYYGGGREWLPGMFLGMSIIAAVMAWFHMKSVGIAYWMFVIIALRQVPLRKRAILNFILINACVFVLTFIGNVLTIGCAFLGVRAYENSHMGEVTFFVSVCLAPLFIVGYLKTFIASVYELSFWRAYLYYCWYGAAEENHPDELHHAFRAPAAEWVAFLRREESSLKHSLPVDEQPPPVPRVVI
ncbi:MAG: hypothetical protein ABI579_00640 [Candidatus Sumerlaeota bacterium]